MNNITDIIRKHTAGEATLEETNVALKDAGSNLYINPDKHAISSEEAGHFGLLDTGTGSLDKVEVKDGRLVNCDCGEMTAFCTFNGKTYTVHGDTLID